MTLPRVRRWWLPGWAVLSCVLTVAPARAADAEKKHPAVTPASRSDEWWTKRHQAFLDRVRQGDVDVVFIGDSITQGWEGAGKNAWQKHFAPLRAINLGIGGDRTQHVLWRLEHGELEGIRPKVAVIMIGTNNLGARDGRGGNSNEEIADGVRAVVQDVRRASPPTKILLLGIFPRGEAADNPYRKRIREINWLIARMDDSGRHVHYQDIGHRFLEKDGSLSKKIMPDYLHLSEEGYDRWAAAVEPVIRDMMGTRTRRGPP